MFTIASVTGCTISWSTSESSKVKVERLHKDQAQTLT